MVSPSFLDGSFPGPSKKEVSRPVAPTVEQRIPNPCVVGSSPSWPANFRIFPLPSLCSSFLPQRTSLYALVGRRRTPRQRRKLGIWQIRRRDSKGIRRPTKCGVSRCEGGERRIPRAERSDSVKLARALGRVPPGLPNFLKSPQPLLPAVAPRSSERFVKSSEGSGCSSMYGWGSDVLKKKSLC